MLIPPDWSRPRKQIAIAYFRHIGSIPRHQSIIKVIGTELGYTMNKNGSYSFVADVIRELRQLTVAG